MKEKIILAGGGGHCKACIDVIRSDDRFNILGIVERSGFDLQDGSLQVCGVNIIGTDDDLPELVKKCPNFLVTLGQIKNPAARIRLFNLIRDLGGHLPAIISPLAFVSPTARIGAGTIIMHQALVNAEAIIGINCIINTGALVEHEASVGNHTHISTHAIVNGQCTVGSQTLVGSGTVMANNVAIPDNTLVAAGSVVLRSLDKPGTYLGNPLRKIR